MQGFFNNQRLVAPSAAFHWQARWGGAEVFVTGDWCAWAVRDPPACSSPFLCLAASARGVEAAVSGGWTPRFIGLGRRLTRCLSRSSSRCGETPSARTFTWHAAWRCVTPSIPVRLHATAWLVPLAAMVCCLELC